MHPEMSTGTGNNRNHYLNRSDAYVVAHRAVLNTRLQQPVSDSCSPRFVFSSQTKEVIKPQAVRVMFELDFNEKTDKDLSVEDKQFLTLLDSEIEKHERQV